MQFMLTDMTQIMHMKALQITKASHLWCFAELSNKRMNRMNRIS